MGEQPCFIGEYNPLRQLSKGEIEKNYDKLGSEEKWFLIEKNDGNKIGFIGNSPVRGYWELGYVLIPSERGKGYCAEAVQLMVDYLFLSRDTVKIQTAIHVDNIASQKVLERTGFTREMDSRERRCQFGESGLTVTYTAFSGKNGKNQKY